MSQEEDAVPSAGLPHFDAAAAKAAHTPIDAGHSQLASRLPVTLQWPMGLVRHADSFYVAEQLGQIYRCALDGSGKTLVATIPANNHSTSAVIHSVTRGNGTRSGGVPALHITDKTNSLWCVIAFDSSPRANS